MMGNYHVRFGNRLLVARLVSEFLLYSLDEVRFYGAIYVYSNLRIEYDQNNVLRGAPSNRKKQVLGVNQSMRVRVSSHILSVGCERFGASARLLNDEARGISSLSEGTSTVNSSGAAEDIKNGALKLEVHNLFEKSETQLKSLKVGSCDAVQKKFGSVIKKDVTEDGKSLNEFTENVSHETVDFNMIVAQKKKERVNILVGKIRDKWSDKKRKFVNLHEVIFDCNTLIYAYGDLVKSKGANTKEGDSINLDGINTGGIIALSDELRNGFWKASAARRILIPKKRSGETRPLTILAPYDKIVATAIQIVLNLIFEMHDGLNMLPKDRYFAESSHGFRPNRGCHTALNVITTWGLGKWLIPADISRCLDTIDQKRLMSIIGESIEDQVLIDTFYKFFNVKIKGVEEDSLDTNKGIGVPQGNPFSPLLANIYLNEFDQFVMLLKKEVDKGTVLPRNTKEWQDATEVRAKELKRARSRRAKNNLKTKICRSKIKAARKAGIRQKPETDADLPKRIYHRIYYLRYADDYLIAIKGTKQLAKQIKKKTEDFLKSNLHFDLKSKELIHGKDNKASFLGFDIKVPSRRDRVIVETRKRLSFKKINNRISSRKRTIEARFEKAILRVYETQKLKTLKALMKGEKSDGINENVAKYLAMKDAKELMREIELSGIKWIFDKEPFDVWMRREYRSLQESWIKKTELEELGYSEIIRAYDKFIETLKEGMGSKNLCRFKEEEARRIKAKPKYLQMELDRLMYGQPQSLQPRIHAPICELKDRMRSWGMISHSGKPKFCGIALKYHEVSIIEFFRQKALGFLNYYKPASNFHDVKKLVDYHMRWSLLHTLAAKYSTRVHKIINKFGKTPKVILALEESKELVLAEFLSPNDINHRTRGFLISEDPIVFKNSLDKPIAKLAIPKVLFASKCAIIGCERSDIEVHHVRTLRRIRHGFAIESIKSKGRGIKREYAKIESALNRKQIPLCKEHHKLWHTFRRPQLDKQYLKEHVEPIVEASKAF